MLVFTSVGPKLEFDKYMGMIKQELFYYEIRVPGVLGKKEIQEWFQEKSFQATSLIQTLLEWRACIVLTLE